MIARLSALIVAMVLAGCASSAPELPAQFEISPSNHGGAAHDYRMGPLDVLTVTVFQVEDLSFEELPVNPAGNIQLPLIGTVRAQGLTTDELATEIERRLAVRYLRNPEVSVFVREAVSQKVTVDGAVTEPGVFEMRGRTTLMQAVAMAKGPTRTAALDRVVVFRNVDGQRMAARFSLRDIRSGELQDPVLLGEDIVVVDNSFTSAAMRDLFALLPSLAVFAAY